MKQRQFVNNILIGTIVVCLAYLIINKLTKRDYFEDICTIDISSVNTNTVIDNLHLADHYDANDKTNSTQSPETLEKLRKSSEQIDEFEALLKSLAANESCKNSYLTVLNIYALNNGLTRGPAERLSSFRGLLLYLNISSRYLLYKKQMPNNQLVLSGNIDKWLNDMCKKWSAQFKNYKNNQQLFYISAKLLDCYINNTCKVEGATSLISYVENYHIMTNMQNGFIESEMGRGVRAYTYHTYYLSALFGCLTIIKNTKNSFNWKKTKPLVQKVIENVTTLYKGKSPKYRIADNMKPKLANPDSMIDSNPNGFMNAFNYFYNNGPAPDLLLSGINMTIRQFASCFK